MKIFIKTELYKNSKYLPHLLEHCIWDAKNPENYFKTISKNFLTCFNDYILIETVEKNIEKIKEIIFKIPDKNKINFEKKVLKDELTETYFKKKIENKIWKILFWKDLNLIKNQKVSFEEVLDYHKKKFKKENIIFTTDDFEILEDNFIFEEKFSKKLDFKEKSFYLKVDKIPCFVYVKKFENYLDYFLFFFLEYFYENLFSYQIRFQEWFYFYEHDFYSFRLYDTNIFFITCENLDFEEEFFIQSKKYFLEYLKENFKKANIICKMIYWQKPDFTEVEKFFEKFSSSKLRKIFDLK